MGDEQRSESVSLCRPLPYQTCCFNFIHVATFNLALFRR